MKNENCKNYKWKFLIVLIFLLSLASAMILINNESEKYVYTYRIIELDNDYTSGHRCNFGEDIEVVDYLCDDGVYINNNFLSSWFFVSVCPDDINAPYMRLASRGICVIKVRERI